MSEAINPNTEWALKLFAKSPLKQRKLEMIAAYLPDLAGKVCLDIGSDNGVISLLLRRRGGHWHSADLIAETVASIQGLVGDRVVQIDGQTLPFETAYFDLVVIVDLLEHIETDREFIAELYRCIKPGGALVINVPDPKEGWFRRLRFAFGQTDLAHGHIRPGYSSAALRELLGAKFTVQAERTYARFFSELIDFTITAALDFLQKGKRGKKGTVVTKDDLNKQRKMFKLYSLIYPFMATAMFLDRCSFFLRGNMRIAQARRN